MPNLGPGIAVSTVPTAQPTLVYTPTPSVQGPSIRITNNGGVPVYLGQSNVSQYNGLPLYPGNRPVELQNCPVNVYVSGGAFASGPSVVTNATAFAAGATSFTVTTTGLTANTTPFTVILGSGTGQELVSITSISSSTVITCSATLQDHVGGVTVATAVVRTANVTASAGVA